MPDQTPYEKLKRANDDYHDAVDEILLGEDVPVGVKVEFGTIIHEIFHLMQKANLIVTKYYQ